VLKKFSFGSIYKKRSQNSHHKVENRPNKLLRRLSLKHPLSLPDIKEHKEKSRKELRDAYCVKS